MKNKILSNVVEEMSKGNHKVASGQFSKYMTEKARSILSEAYREFNQFETMQEIVDTFNRGETVYWQSDGYTIQDWGNKDAKLPEDKFKLMIVYADNNSAIGLFKRGSTETDYLPTHFYTKRS